MTLKQRNTVAIDQHNYNSGKVQQHFITEIRGKVIRSKPLRQITHHFVELPNRIALRKNLKHLQGENYTVELSKRYYTSKTHYHELNYQLPNAGEICEHQTGRVKHELVQELVKRSGFPINEIRKKIEEGISEIRQKYYSHEKMYIDFAYGNFLVDVHPDGKIRFIIADA
ncbi:MAG: hypothetical protein NTY48_07615 [Candidatus Diapherotrites archaeon]|nr:hypothetical protein [Candidatus Diapherotrites archaeon]